jgi:hypothetical protein
MMVFDKMGIWICMHSIYDICGKKVEKNIIANRRDYRHRSSIPVSWSLSNRFNTIPSLQHLFIAFDFID